MCSSNRNGLTAMWCTRCGGRAPQWSPRINVSARIARCSTSSTCRLLRRHRAWAALTSHCKLTSNKLRHLRVRKPRILKSTCLVKCPQAEDGAEATGVGLLHGNFHLFTLMEDGTHIHMAITVKAVLNCGRRGGRTSATTSDCVLTTTPRSLSHHRTVRAGLEVLPRDLNCHQNPQQ